jgi:hypothetical protein
MPRCEVRLTDGKQCRYEAGHDGLHLPNVWWHVDDGVGPPTPMDDMWFHEHVRAAGYPRVKRDPEPMNGQVALFCGADLKTWDELAGEDVPTGLRCDREAGHSGDHRCIVRGVE